jgi:hypothetical protein
VTRQEIEKRIDELTRKVAETQGTKVRAELEVLTYRLACMPHATASVEEVFKELASDKYFNDQSAIPQPPKITEDQLKQCQDNSDFCPILFEWYKFVGLLAISFAQLERRSLGVREIEPLEYHVLIGLLTRCSRLMLANVALSHQGVFGETTAIIDRCIFESAVKIIWLVNSQDKEKFRRFIADGLKTELELKKEIDSIIASRDGHQLVIEKRMLESIQRAIESSGMSAQEVADTKKLPDLAAMMNALGDSRFMYLAGRKIGSHHVHGTWVSLIRHYLQDVDGEIRPRDHDVRTADIQFIVTSFLVLSAIEAFLLYVLVVDDTQKLLLRCVNAVKDEIQRINVTSAGNDYELDTP